MDLTDEQCFVRVLAAFAGERFPLDAAASKVMRFMLFDRSGCDAAITPRGFEINFGWHYRLQPYVLQAAPGIVSWLLATSDDVCDAYELPAAVGPIEIPAALPFVLGQNPASHAWMLAEPNQVSIRVRDSVAALTEPLPVPKIPPPFVELRHPCRHCGRVPERYRVLRDHSLVCLACGRSQPPP